MGKFNDLLIEIGIDTKPAMDKINKLDKAFDDLGKSFQAVTRKKPPKDQFNLGAERAKMQRFIRELKSLGAETETYQKQLKGLKNASQFKSMQQDLAKYKKDFLAFKDAESKDNLKTVKDRQKAETRANSEIERARIKQAQDTNKKLTEEHSKKSPELQSMKEFYQQQEREARKGSPKEKKRSQADINRENSLLKQKKLLKEIKALKLKPDYDKLDTIAKQNTALERQIKKYKAIEEYSEKAARNIYRSEQFRSMSPSDQRQVSRRVSQAQSDFKVTGDKDVFRTLNRDVKSFQRSLIGLQTVQNGLSDSTRNMVRAYASLFALIEGTTAIKNVGMDFQGMEASMLASAGTSEKARKDLSYINDLADEMGLNLKNTTDAYVKLQFATKGKIDDKQVKNLFTGLAEFGTALKVAPESMKLAQRAFMRRHFH
jgi:myosin heavy subunit|tara:strand:+ start:4292 stop:5581 length:1290 start_codon:yes stop_codon:yes gene_type:complete